jgi:hypothetical protein
MPYHRATMKPQDKVTRAAILAGVAGLTLLVLASALQRPAYRPYSGVSYPQYGVSFFWEMDAVLVTIDGREERVPTAKLRDSAIYQEACARIPRSDRPAITQVGWYRVFGRWLPLVVLSWWALFRVWQPRRPYVEGGKAV